MHRCSTNSNCLPLSGWNGCVIRIRRSSWLGMGAIEGTLKKMTTLRILLELPDYQGIEAVEAKPHVRFAGGYENPRGCAQPEHPATPAVTSGRANPRRRALQSNAAVRP